MQHRIDCDLDEDCTCFPEVSMFSMSVPQALSIWSELEDALRGEHGFGGHVAEIYVYRASMASPSNNVEQTRLANASLRELFELFQIFRNSVIRVADRTLGDWMDESENDWRWHVEVQPKKTKK